MRWRLPVWAFLYCALGFGRFSAVDVAKPMSKCGLGVFGR